MYSPNQSVKSQQELMGKSAAELRQIFRRGLYQGTTAGLADGNLQCNLVVLPAQYKQAFTEFCRVNPTPCPMIASTEPGVASFTDLGEDIDFRSDLPAYYVFKYGEFYKKLSSLNAYWDETLCGIAIGCSFSFEYALQKNGISLRHIELGTTVPMFRTSLECIPKEPFHGQVVVSMRLIKHHDIDKVYEICADFPESHGEPIHAGDPLEIGIGNLDAPDWGCAVPIHADEVPVFWGCGVTTQVAIQNARLPLSFSHAPGAMLITDISEYSDFKPHKQPA